MAKRDAGRAERNVTPADQARIRREREEIAGELPDLCARDQMRKEALEEPTLSGALRRAVHASPLSLSTIADRAGMAPAALDEFLTGERTVRSDVLDRLAAVLGFEPSRRSEPA